jgi:glycosyltransferase involved in cell wall biosynthesis
LRRVLLVNWDSYPNLTSGGVHTWAKSLIEGMPEWEFVVINALSNANTNARYSVPPNVTRVIEVPIFGRTRFEEFYPGDASLLLRGLRTTERVVKSEFLPIFEDFLRTIVADGCDTRRVAELVPRLHGVLASYDPGKCLENPWAWEAFLKVIGEDALYSRMPLRAALTAFHILQKNLQVLSIEVPKVDLVHCSLAWLPSLISLCAKDESKCPVVVTEHGLAFRELLLHYDAYAGDDAAKLFWKVLSGNVVKTLYSAADAITTGCQMNASWEMRLGADPDKIRVIHNGVDTQRFRPTGERRDPRPTVVCVARVDVLKDILNLIFAMKHVSQEVPEARCLVYGVSTNLEYSKLCVDKVRELHLEESVQFMGATTEPERAYNSADVVAFSSLSEGFPFAVIEAMACGKAIVATDVGGVREALQGCGVIVRSRRPRELAAAVVRLLGDEGLRSELGSSAAKRARERFTSARSAERYANLYEQLLSGSPQSVSAEAVSA